jgi:hypothetical protein
VDKILYPSRDNTFAPLRGALKLRARYKPKTAFFTVKADNLPDDRKLLFHQATPGTEFFMETTYVVRESNSMVFNVEGEKFTAKTLTSAKRRASRMQFFQGTNLQLEYANGNVISVKEWGEKWDDSYLWKDDDYDHDPNPC